MCVCVCVYVCVWPLMPLPSRAARLRMYACACTLWHKRTHTHLLTHACMRACTLHQSSVRVHTRTWTHAHTNTNTRTHDACTHAITRALQQVRAADVLVSIDRIDVRGMSAEDLAQYILGAPGSLVSLRANVLSVCCSVLQRYSRHPIVWQFHVYVHMFTYTHIPAV